MATATTVAVIALLLPIGSRALAQLDGRLAISGGIGTDQHGTRSNALTFAPSFRLLGENGSTMSLSANGTRYANNSWSLGAGVMLSGRQNIARALVLTVNASADGSQLRTRQSASASFVAAELLPAFEVSANRFTAFGGARLATGYASQTARSQSLPPFGPSTTSTTRGRTGVGPAFGAYVDVLPSSPATLRIGAREDRLRVAGVSVADRSLSASIATHRLTLNGNVGQRYASDERLGFHNVGLAIALNSDVTLQAGAGRYASNRLTGTPSGQYLTAGLSFRFGGRSPRGDTPSPSPPGAPRLAPGLTRLSIEAPDAARVDVAGDFNHWELVPAARATNGVWYADLRIPPGRYRYAFRVNGKEWRVPREATVTDDGFGGKSAWLSVGESRSRSRNSQGGR